MEIFQYFNVFAFVVVIGALAYFFWTKRKQVERQLGFIFIYRTKVGIEFINKLAKKFKNCIIYWGYTGIFVGFLSMIGILFLLTKSVFNMFAHPELAQPSAGLVLPGISTGVVGPVIFVSIWYFLIGLTVTLLVHEGSHGLVARAHNFKIKSTGIGIFGILPFAFVEPDESKINKTSLKKQLSIFAAGPFANLFTAALVGLFAFFILLPAVSEGMQINGIEINELNEGLPATLAGLEAGDVIVQVNDMNFSEMTPKPTALTFSYLHSLSIDWPEIKPGQIVEVITKKGKRVNITATSAPRDPSTVGNILLNMGLIDEDKFSPRGVIGLKAMTPQIVEKTGSSVRVDILGGLYNIFAWIFIFNLGIGLVNLLPIGPLDGGRMIRSIFERKHKKLVSLLSYFALTILILSIIGSYLVKFLL